MVFQVGTSPPASSIIFFFSDSQVLLFLADDMACNGRNGAPGAVYHHRNKILDLYGRDVEVDFRGEEVTVQNLIRLLTGRQDKGLINLTVLFICVFMFVFRYAT